MSNPHFEQSLIQLACRPGRTASHRQVRSLAAPSYAGTPLLTNCVSRKYRRPLKIAVRAAAAYHSHRVLDLRHLASLVRVHEGDRSDIHNVGEQ